MRAKNKKGFTLLELMISVGITAIISAAILNIFSIGLSSWQIGEAKIESQYQARKAMQEITQDLRLSNPGHIDVLNDSNTEIQTGIGTKLRFQVPSYDNKIIHFLGGDVALAAIRLDNDNNIIWGADNTNGYFIQYQLVTSGTNHQLARVILNSSFTQVSRRVLANNILAVGFKGIPSGTSNPRSVEISITGSNTINTGRSVSFKLTSLINARN
ncbi:MAG: prepilin-type N-terminal cleavage/methylation domain-containing protein [Candidatus Omnitrophica bacterium]|jgi:prepilin-type N-terminal cleavage/methylation domain-containing protein|nr:prepilin-type N-terminal cleavage/methylation domain-containing protein [Candidatus Omnitrophota bacterium]